MPYSIHTPVHAPVKSIRTSYPVNATRAFIPLILILILIISQSRSLLTADSHLIFFLI